jgi:hypothetical protein
MRRMAVMLTLLAAFALGGCGGSDEPAGSGGGGGVATTAAPTPTAAAPATSEPAVLEDGRHPVYLKTVDSGRRTITFDLVQLFTGDAAARAAAEDGKESPPPNDIYIRNVNARLRTLPVAADAPITANTLTAQSSGSATKDVPLTLDELAGYFPTAADPFWITVQGGQVTRMAQQYLP